MVISNNIQTQEDDLMKTAEMVENDTPMSGKIKYDLREKINSLSTSEHICLFSILFKNMAKKVYTVTNSRTFFDLNDLDNRTLWKLEKFVSLTLNKMEQDRELEKIEHEKKISELALKNKSKESKTDDSLIPRTKPKPNNTRETLIYNEFINNRATAQTAAMSDTSATSVTAHAANSANATSNATTAMISGNGGSGGSVSVNNAARGVNKTNKEDTKKDKDKQKGKSFIGGSLVITDEDMMSETGTLETNDNNNDDDAADDTDDDDNLEDDDEDEELDEDGEELDPNQMIRNGGQPYIDDE